jgi:hypothetical protein
MRAPPPSEDEIPDDLHGADEMLLRRMKLEQLMKDLPHFDDTPADLKADIDRCCALIVDWSAGADQHRARASLVRLKRPSMPRILSAFLKTGDWGTDEGRILGVYVDNTLREIVWYPDRYMKHLDPMSGPTKEDIAENARRWFIWWYSVGYKLETYEEEEEEEDEEDR